jgi:hypothetical protein
MKTSTRYRVSLTLSASLLFASAEAFAQQVAPAVVTAAGEVACTQSAGLEHEAALNRLAASPRFAVAIERCEAGTATRCGAYRCLAQGQLAANVELDAFLAVGGNDASASAGGSVRVDDTRGLGESVDSLASASALFEVVTQGLASFLVERARVELQRGVTDRIRAEACGDDVPLANTCGMLGTPEQALAGPTFGAGLRTAFERDVIELPRWALAHAEPVTDEATMTRRFALALTVALARRSSPVAVAEALDQEMSSWGGPSELVGAARQGVRGYRRIAFAMAVAAGQGDRLSPTTRARLVQIAAGTSLGARPLGDDALPALFELSRRAYDAQRAADDLGNPALSESTRRSRIGTLAVNLVAALRSTIALSSAGRTLAPSLDRAMDTVLPVFDAMATGDVARVFAASAGALRTLDVTMSPRASLALRVLALGAEFASARTARQAEAAITSFAAPPGTWQAKHEHPGLWLNGFVGVGGGAEVLFASTGVAAGGYIAPYAPVGLDLTRPLGSRSWAFGVFIPVIDLGALVSASTAAQGIVPPSMSMGNAPRASTSPGQFLAPGLYARLNFARSPLVLSVGASVLPFGREVDFGGGRTETMPALRAGASLSVDIPIIPFSF